MLERRFRGWLWAALLAVACNAMAGGGEFSYMTLNGVRAAAVEVYGVEPEFARYGLTPQPLRAAVEAQLRQAGIEVLSYDEAVRQPHAALVQLKLRTNQSEYQFYFYNFALEVREKIPLDNAAGGFISALIWSDARQGSVQPTDMPRLAGVADELVAGFVREHQTQNTAPAGIKH